MPTNIQKEFKERLGWLTGPLLKLSKLSHAAQREPSTVIARIGNELYQSLERQRERVGDERFAEDLLLCWLPEEGDQRQEELLQHRHLKQRARTMRSPLGCKFLKLLDEAHGAVPNAPLLCLSNPATRDVAVLSMRSAQNELKGLRGEHRARRLWQLAQQATESVYRPHAEQLWHLREYAQSRRSRTIPKFGAIIQQLAQCDDGDPPLVDPDAAHVRNASSHSGRVNYDPLTRRSLLCDASGWNRDFDNVQLQRYVNRLIEADATLHAILLEFNAHVLGTTLVPLLRDIGRAYRSREPVAIEQAARALDDGLEALYAQALTLV